MAAKRKRNAAAKAKSKSSPTQATPPKQKEKKLVDEGEQLTPTALSDTGDVVAGRSSRKRNVSSKFAEYMQSIQKDQQKAKRRKTTIQAKATTGDAKKEDNSDDVTLFDEQTVNPLTGVESADENQIIVTDTDQSHTDADVELEQTDVEFTHQSDVLTGSVETVSQENVLSDSVEDADQVNVEQDASPHDVEVITTESGQDEVIEDSTSYSEVIVMENTYQEEVATQPVPQSSSDIIETGQAVDALIHQVTNPQLTTDVIIDPEHVQETGSEVIIQETEHHGNADTNLQLVCLEEQAQTEEEMTVVEIPSQVTSEQEIVETQTVDENGAVVTVQTIRDGNWVEVTEQRPPVRKPHGVRIENVVQPRNKKPLPVTAPHTNIIPNMQRLQSGQTSIIAHNSENQPVPLILSSDDQETQALLNSFIAENTGNTQQQSQALTLLTETNQTTQEVEAVVPPHIQLSEQVQVDADGREQTVVYLTHKATSLDGADSSGVDHSVSQSQSSIPVAHVSLTPNAESSAASILTSQQNVSAMSADGTQQLRHQDVVLEVLVDRGNSCTVQEVRVVDPYSSQTSHSVVSQVTDVYACNVCNYRSESKDYLIKHMKVHRNSNAAEKEEMKHQCSLCSYKSKVFSNLKRHMLSHTDDRQFPCTMCDLKFKQKIHLQKHINYIHLERSVHCQYCDYVCANAIPDLKLHMRRKHLKSDPEDPPTYLECDKCGFLAASNRDLKQHSKFHKRGPELKLFCEHCSFVTDAKSRLDRHKMTHTKEKPFTCPICPYKASQKEHLRRHVKTKHNGDGLSDVIADTQTSQQDNDQLVHTDASDVSLLTTEVVTEEESSNLGDGHRRPSHIGTDEEERLHEATDDVMEDSVDHAIEQVIESTVDDDDDKHCSVGLSGVDIPLVINTVQGSQRNKRENVQKYTPPDYSSKEKLFGCSHCTMKFVRLLSLYKHLHTQHSDLLPDTEDEKLTCVICDFKAPTHKALLMHMRKHNASDQDDSEIPGMLYVCVLCKYMNGKRRNLYQHLKKKHKISIIVKKDGTTSCIVEPNADVTVVASSEGQEVTEVVGNTSLNPSEPSKLVNLVDLANSLTYRHEISSLIQRVDMSSAGNQTEQAAAEAIVDLATQSIMQSETEISTTPAQAEDMMDASAEAILESDESGQGQLQISAQQLHQLSSGDYIEINGETYKVELQGESMTAVLCEPGTEPEIMNDETDSQLEQVPSDTIVTAEQVPEQSVNTVEHVLPDVTEVAQGVIVDATSEQVPTVVSTHHVEDNDLENQQ